MPVSQAQRAKRAYVKVLNELAMKYNMNASVGRDCNNVVLSAFFRKLVRRTHPDKGGNAGDAQTLHAARDTWVEETSKTPPPGRPKQKPAASSHDIPVLPVAVEDVPRKAFRIQSEAAMFTYQGIKDLKQWRRLVAFVRYNLVAWTVKLWCVTLETSPTTGTLHAHLYLQFSKMVDRTSTAHIFEGIRPNISTNDYCGEGINRKRAQESMNRGFFYVWADKIGTVRETSGAECVDGNYMPCWTNCSAKYGVSGRWPQKLWQLRKLTHDRYEEYLFLCRDSCPARKRNLDVVKEHEQQTHDKASREMRIKRTRNNPEIFHPFPVIPAVSDWLQTFQRDALRYAFLVVHGVSRAGKTEFAKSLFKCPLELKVGSLAQFPEGMRAFDRSKHDGIVLDDVRDLTFLVQHQEKLQGKYDYSPEFASTPGGQCSFQKDLFAVPIVATINNSTKNLKLLLTDDFLAHEGNRVYVKYGTSEAQS